MFGNDGQIPNTGAISRFALDSNELEEVYGIISDQQSDEEDDPLQTLLMSMRDRKKKKTPSVNIQNEYLKMVDNIDFLANGPPHHYNTINNKF